MVDRDVRRTRRVIVRHQARPARIEDAALIEGQARPEAPEPQAPPAPPDGDPPADPFAIGAKTPLGMLRVPERPAGFPTEAQLADHDAEAQGLRAELDELRRRLDAPIPPITRARAATSWQRRRKPLLGVLVVGGALGIVATATLTPWSSSQSTGTAGAAAAPVTSGVITPPVPVPPTFTNLGAGLSGPGIDAPGTILLVRTLANGDLDVVEQAVMGPRGLRQITLSLPSLTGLGGPAGALRPVVSNLQVSVNGNQVLASRPAGSAGWVVVPTERARVVRLSYRLSGTRILSPHSDPSNGLAVALPLLGETLRQQGLRMQARVSGAGGVRVLGITCPAAGAGELCGDQLASGQGWSALVPDGATSPALLLQLKLPR